MEIGERKKLILRYVVDSFIQTGEAVSSKMITDLLDFRISSATIRNEMAELEELGYLIKPHTSAGRIPSDKGYRLYVDELMERRKLEENEREALGFILNQRASRFENLFTNGIKAISDLTKYTTVVLVPRTLGEIKNIEILPMDSKMFVLILVTTSGVVRNQIYRLSEDVPESDLRNLGRVLNYHFAGRPLESISSDMLVEITRAVLNSSDRISHIISAIREILRNDDNMDLYLEGMSNIFNFPEFYNVDNVRDFMGFFDNQNELREVMKSEDDDIKVLIGSENPYEEMNRTSFVTKRYKLNGRIAGSIGIVGPTRMDYSRVMSIIDFVTDFFDKF